jgi:hypothetical protein
LGGGGGGGVSGCKASLGERRDGLRNRLKPFACSGTLSFGFSVGSAIGATTTLDQTQINAITLN